MPKQSAAIVVIAAFSCGAMESSRYIISDVSRNQSSLPSRHVPDSTRTAGESGRSARAPDAPIQSTSRNVRNRNASMHRATRALLQSLDIRHFFVVGRARLPLSLRTTTIIACCESLVATHKKSSRLASFRHRGAADAIGPAACAAANALSCRDTCLHSHAQAAAVSANRAARDGLSSRQSVAAAPNPRIVPAGAALSGRMRRRIACMREHAGAMPRPPAAAHASVPFVPSARFARFAPFAPFAPSALPIRCFT
ncbi:hypothetical protein [Burkholderia pseudomallei]|uniref:hypothetical protein n=1 Tax=Burkholderia pseudomallei TaxID=28450 RepID=UPI001F375717|nr:hypothetical protein [Burkholderia pseudomallei]